MMDSAVFLVVMIIILSIVFLLLNFIFGVQPEWDIISHHFEKKEAEKRKLFEKEKKQLKSAVLQIVDAQAGLPRECGDVIRNEIKNMACESYIVIQFPDGSGSVRSARVPNTLWNILKWLTLRNSELTKLVAQNLEQVTVKRRLGRGGTVHPYSTVRRIEVLFERMANPPEDNRKFREQLDQRTMTNYHDLANALSEYGQKLTNREPLRRAITA